MGVCGRWPLVSKRTARLLNDPILKRQVDERLDADGWVRPALQKRAEDTRDRLIEAAEEVFAEKGYSGARINDIAARADVSAASVYVRFKDKDGLFNAVLDRFREQIATILDHFLNGIALDEVDTETALHAIVMDNADKLTRNAGIMRATLQRGLSEPDIMARFLNMRQMLITHITAFVARRSADETPDAIRARVTDAFDTIYGGLLTRIILCGERSEPFEFAAYLAELVTPHILNERQQQ